MTRAEPDVAIVGGGVIGSSIAHFLCSDEAFRGRVVVIERDPTYSRASSALSASSIRQQFTTAINVRMSLFGIQFLREAGRLLATDDGAPDIGLREQGYLFLATEETAERMRACHRLQVECGADIVLLDPVELESAFRGLRADGVALGSYGRTGEGWFDGYALLQAFRRSARARGAEYITASVTHMSVSGDAVTAVHLDTGETLSPRTVVDAAGPHARAVAAMVGIDLPVEARPRSVFVLEHRAPISGYPLVIDVNGTWFRPEGERIIAGVSPPAERDREKEELEVAHALFEDIVWPTLAHRVPALEAVRVSSAWAGHYEMNTFDHNALLGPHPLVRNLIFANGFSGHGMQQSPAVGRGIAELIVHGRYRSLELSELSVSRLVEGRRVVEEGVV
jgi:FAD-dependent oxidoreductase domain-containing protein 1